MSDMPTIIETGKNNDNGWGGNAWGAGAGAFIGSMFGNGGFGGWGGYRDAVIAFCASLVRFLDNQTPQKQEP